MGVRYSYPRYGSGSQAQKDYIALAEHYEMLARNDDEFNRQRKREGKPIVKAVQNSARKFRARAKRMRQMAEGRR